MELSGNNEIKIENTKDTVSGFNKNELSSLSSFFDLLAQFDYEDMKKEKLVSKTDPLVSAPKGSVLGSNN